MLHGESCRSRTEDSSLPSMGLDARELERRCGSRKRTGRVEGTVLEIGVKLVSAVACRGGHPGEFSKEVVSRIFTSWNQVDKWLRQLDRLWRGVTVG
jgi:hypothetical protein